MSHHIPDLDAIQKLPDPEIQFYAVVGAVVSLTAALELKYLDIFVKATGLKRDTAGKVIYKAKNSSLQRDMAIIAMNDYLKSGPLFQEWKTLSDKVIAATGQGGLRHLIAHNTVTKFEEDGCIGGHTLGSLPLAGNAEATFHVFQNQQKVIAGYTSRKAALHQLLAFCRDLTSLSADLESFLART